MSAEKQPEVKTQPVLQGRRVALARAAEDAHTPARALLALGAQLIYYPCFDTLPPEDLAELDREIKRLAAGRYDWLFMTTASAVMILADRLAHLELEPTVVTEAELALFGSNTRLAAADLLHIAIDKLPEMPSHTELAHTLPLEAGDRVLLPVPAGYRAAWVRTLEERGVRVTQVAAYRTDMRHGGDALPEMLWAGAVDAIVFTSENNVNFFAKRLQYEGGSLAMLDDVCVACIGPRTSDAARARGLRVWVEAKEHTPEGLAAGIGEYFATNHR